MRFRLLGILVGLLAILPLTVTYATTRECFMAPDMEKRLVDPDQNYRPRIPYPLLNVRQVFDIYLKAVDDGQLIAFTILFDRSMIEPQLVEYIYTLESDFPTVKVYSNLTSPVPLPIRPDMVIIGISSIMNPDGNIVQSIVHCGSLE